MISSSGKETFFPIALLGIPISNHPLSLTITECMQRIHDNRREGKVTYYATIDNTAIDTSYGWQPSSVNHPELLAVLRNANISRIEGDFLITLAKLLGSTIAPIYTTQELITSLCQALGEKKMGVFLLGDNEKTIKAAAIHLHDIHPQLRLVGATAPPIFVAGRDLATAHERDTLIIEQINASNAEVLIINLASPIQELWLGRVKEHLSVPLVLAVGKSVTDLASSTRPIRQAKAENQIPPKQDKKSFSFFGRLKLSWIACPLLIYHQFNRFLYEKLFSKKSAKPSFQNNKLFLSTYHSIAVIPLPRIINQSVIAILKQLFEESASHDVIIFDFREVRHIQPEGFCFLIKAWLQRDEQNKEIYGFQTSQNVQNLMKFHRTWDLFKNTLCDSPEVLISRLRTQQRTTFYDAFTQAENLVTISMLGALDRHVDYTAYINKLIPMIDKKNCCIDLSYCSFIDNTGFAFLLTLRKHLQAQQHSLTLSGVSPSLKALFHTTSLEMWF